MKTKRPARAKALIINAFALAGRIVFGGFLPQGVALGYVLLPLRGVLLRLLPHSRLLQRCCLYHLFFLLSIVLYYQRNEWDDKEKGLLENQLFCSIFTDYISILSKLR